VCGSVLAATYTRSRWSDWQHSHAVEFDPDPELPVYVEFKTREYKTKKANLWVGGVQVAVAPGLGVASNNSIPIWWKVRNRIHAPLSDGFPVMPSPGEDGLATRRPLSTSEVGAWVRMILGREDLLDQEHRITSHSCKSTLLSFLAKFNIDLQTREILGGHVGRLKSVLTYSRDSLAGPLRSLGSVPLAIRCGTFKPDELRSGRFVKKVKIEIEDETTLPVSTPADKQECSRGDLDPNRHVLGDCEVSAETAMCESDTEWEVTSSSSDEGGAEKSHAARLVTVPTAPEGTVLVQHSKSKMLHLLKQGYRVALMCGRTRSSAYEPPLKVRWDTACCIRCWRSANAEVGPRIK